MLVAPAGDVDGGAGCRQVPGPSGAPAGPPVATAGSGWIVAAQGVARAPGAPAADAARRWDAATACGVPIDALTGPATSMATRRSGGIHSVARTRPRPALRPRRLGRAATSLVRAAFLPCRRVDTGALRCCGHLRIDNRSGPLEPLESLEPLWSSTHRAWPGRPGTHCNRLPAPWQHVRVPRGGPAGRRLTREPAPILRPGASPR
jgi:hypothetical protein